MKHALILLVGLLLPGSFLFSQQLPSPPAKPKMEGQVKQYWFVMLTAGKNRTHDSAAASKIQEGHMANINRLYYEGKLKVAGPFGDDGNWRGIFIFDCSTKEEVEKLLASRSRYCIRKACLRDSSLVDGIYRKFYPREAT